MQRFRSTQINVNLRADTPVQSTPTNNNRCYLGIFNEGPNELRVQLGRPAENPADFTIGGYGSKEWDDNVPIDSVGLYSELGGMVVIIEGNPPL